MFCLKIAVSAMLSKDNEVILKSTPVVVATPQQSNKDRCEKAISGILWVNRSLELPLWRKIMLKWFYQ